MRNDKGRIQIIAITIFIIVVAGKLIFEEENKLDGRKEIEIQIREDFETRKATLKTWADYFFQQKDLPNEWSLENRSRGGLWFHDESPHDGRVNLFQPKFVLPDNLEKQLKLFNISEIYCINDSADSHLEYIYSTYYITSTQDRRLRLIYYPDGINDTLKEEKKPDEFNWQTILEPNWVLKSSTAN